MFRSKQFALGFFAALLPTAKALCGIIYVDGSATLPMPSGATWCEAFRDLQDGLAAAEAGDEIQVANGIYLPDRGTGDRFATFTLKSGVALKGGYAGCGAADPDARDYALYETRLSGDLLQNDGPDFSNYADNSHHVVTYDDPAASGVLIEGFTVSSGNADGPDGLTNQGGGIHIRQGLAKCLPGGPTIRDCIVEKNWGAHHGAINDHGLSTTIENCIVRSNHSDAEGGGLQIHSGAPTITNCTFLENSSAGDGGGVWIGSDEDPTCSGPSTATFINCTFQGNAANRGGGMFQNVDTAPVIIESLFLHNSAHDGGGAWLIENQPAFTDCHFEGNTAENGGGMFQSIGSRPLLSRCTFLQNHAALMAERSGGGAARGEPNSPDGGAVWSVLNEPTFLDCQFIGNTAVMKGGGTWSSRATATFERCLWDGNVSGEDGGGYYAGGSNPTPIVITDSVLRNNSSGRYGGGLDSYAVTATVTGTLFENNHAELSGGGATSQLFFFSLPPSIFEDCDPGACISRFEDCTFRGNTASHGGGFFAAYSARAVIENALFEENEATGSGGGAHVNGVNSSLGADDPLTNNVVIVSSTFRANVGSMGGGLSVQRGGNGTSVRCDFLENSATHGGAVYLASLSRGTALNSRFIGNTAGGSQGSGGALVISDADMTVVNALFAGNAAAYNGGAIQVQSGPNMLIVNTTLTRNTAVNGGAAVLAFNGSIVQLVNSIVWDNPSGGGPALAGPLSANYSTIQGGWPGEGIIDADPQFIDPLGPDGLPGTEDDDLRVGLSSPALNAASASMLPADITDLDGDGDTSEPLPLDLNGEVRIFGTGPDMGALETTVVLCSPGTFSATGEEPCTPCDPGTAQANAGATACDPCAPGTFASAPGATVCSPCPAGTFQPSPGAVLCMACGDCDDGNGCTEDGCDAVSGACVHTEVCTIPAASTWSLASLALLLLICGTLRVMNGSRRSGAAASK